MLNGLSKCVKKKKNKMGCVSKTRLDSPILLPNKTNRLVTTEGGWLSENGLVSGIEDTTRDLWLMSFPRKSTVYWLFGLYGEPTANTHTPRHANMRTKIAYHD